MPRPFRKRWRGLDPLAVLADEILQPVHGFGLGDVELHGLLAHVEVHFSRCSADVAEVGVRHFAGAIYDATHDGDLHAFEMIGARLDARGDGLEIEKGAPTGRAGDVVSLENARPGGLQDIVGQAHRLSRRGFALHEDRVADAVAEQCADVRRGGEECGKKIGLRSGGRCERVLEENWMPLVDAGGEQAEGGNER